MRALLAVLGAVAWLAACGGDAPSTSTSPPTTAAPAAPAAPATLHRDPVVGGPFPALFLAQAQFVATAPGAPATPGPAKLTIARQTDAGWKTLELDDPDSNVFHKALPYEDGILTIGGNQALLREWRFANGAWQSETFWNPKFGGKFDRLRDIERGDVDGDGQDDFVIATHDQGVIAVAHPGTPWRVEEVDRQPDTFVHEIEIGDVDGDGTAEFFATPSKPNKLDAEQPGEVRMYKHTASGWQKTVVDAPTDTHAKEILTADVDGDRKAELYVVWEGAVGQGGALVRPVTVKQYRWDGGTIRSAEVGTIPDRLTRALAAGDVNGDGKIDLVAGSLRSGLWLFEQDGAGWRRSQIDAQSSGFEHPVCLADLDGDGRLELYVASEDQLELRRYVWRDGAWQKTVLAPLAKGDITWNITAGRL